MPLLPPIPGWQIEVVPAFGVDDLHPPSEPFASLVGRRVDVQLDSGAQLKNAAVTAAAHGVATLDVGPLVTSELTAIGDGTSVSLNWGSEGTYWSATGAVDGWTSPRTMRVSCGWPPMSVERRRFYRAPLEVRACVMTFGTEHRVHATTTLNASVGGVAVRRVAGLRQDDEVVSLFALPQGVIAAITRVVSDEDVEPVSRLQFAEMSMAAQ